MQEPPTMDPFLEEQMRNFEINDRPPSFRHSRAFRNFKNPPQPHMCIRDTTQDGGHEVLINVMSWTRIVKPQTPNDPIPLYGGMRVLGSSSNRSPPTQTQSQPQPHPAMLFAVMANPEVLKKASRNSGDDQDLTALVELMCEFVEAMNPGLKLLRQPVVLKDRDLSGELKNIWGAVQAKRETEREQFSSSSSSAGRNANANLVVYTELGPESVTGGPTHQQPPPQMIDGEVEVTGNGNGVASVEGEDSVFSKNNPNGEQPLPLTDAVDSNSGVDSSSRRRSTEGVSMLTSNGNNNNSNNNCGVGGGDEEGKDEEDTQPAKSESEPETINQDTHCLSDKNNTANVPQGDVNPPVVVIDTPTVRVEQPSSPAVVSSMIPVPVVVSAKSNGKAEKEVANVKEKKEKSISGFLHGGLFGKRNKDKDNNGVAKEKGSGGGKVKLGSFKSKLLLSGSREKEDKGKGLQEATNNTATQFNEIGQSLTTAK